MCLIKATPEIFTKAGKAARGGGEDEQRNVTVWDWAWDWATSWMLKQKPKNEQVGERI